MYACTRTCVCVFVMIYLCLETESGSVEPRHRPPSRLHECGARRVREGTERGTGGTGGEREGHLGGWWSWVGGGGAVNLTATTICCCCHLFQLKHGR